MLNENAQKWVEALESGRYKQGRNALVNENYSGDLSYCCLGVACEVAIENGLEIERVRNYYINNEVIYEYNGSSGFLPESVREWLGLQSNSGKYDRENFIVKGTGELATDNDEGHSFQKIAETIKCQPRGLFE